MARLTWRNVYQVDLGPLKSAVAQWDTMAGELKDVAAEARRGMLKKSEKARWAGVNADVTKPFIASVAAEIEDAHTEAKDLHAELSAAYSSFKAVQDELQAKVDGARRKGIEISDGKGAQILCKYPPQPGHQNESLPKDKLKELKALAEDLQDLVARANERDAYTAGILARIHGGDPHNFAKNGPIDKYKAKMALHIARKGTGASNKEIRELAELLKYNKDNPTFSHAFFKGLGGPKETLAYYAKMAIDGTKGSSETRLDAIQDLQRYMGPTLATATDPDHKGHLDWGAEFRRLGTKEIGVDELGFKPKGYQVLGNILRYGDYDKRFLTPIAEHIVQLQHDHPKGLWNRPTGPDTQFGLDPNGKGNVGYDPVTSVLEALGHSPEAAEEFFSKDPKDGSVVGYDENGKVDPGKSVDYRYLEELMRKDYPWNNDGSSPVAGEEVHRGKNALGHALEAATLGRPYDRPPEGGRHPEHTTDRAQIVRRITEIVSKDRQTVTGDISDSFGRIAGEYMPEINRALATGDPRGDHQAFKTEHTVDFDRQRTVRFLDTIGRHPEGQAEATLGAQRYQAELMREAVRHPDSFPGTTAETMRHIAWNGGTLEGILGAARHDAIMVAGQEAETKFNEAVEERGEMAKQVVGLPLGAAAERVPVAGDLATGTVESIIDLVVESHKKDTLEQDAADGAAVSFDTRRAAETWAEHAARSAGYPPRVDHTDFIRSITQEATEGYDHGEQLRENAYDNKMRRISD
ncbi:DUF6571 family protein [Streptomyces albus]|uniref:DUF6571 family protein n=1 Tax=Streptomyces albus TaxID=1888 RepID=UPI0006E1A55E|nr:DUF6571 family protein [Streptomyces albus]